VTKAGPVSVGLLLEPDVGCHLTQTSGALEELPSSSAPPTEWTELSLLRPPGIVVLVAVLHGWPTVSLRHYTSHGDAHNNLSTWVRSIV
jgi:hypothetical protein